MKKEQANPVPQAMQAEVDALAAAQTLIRTDLIPEATGDWSQGQRGLFYRPVKQQITLRLDADLIDWFKRNHPQGEGYQTSINRALREYIAHHQL
ncbi:BrnA antitoxin family protein [Candidatus Cyanaurora vandensis]|uniref:BrnA antitoxin family protein n=1 Tax=Candidatus Cyanaurora vandensis TaxID=2714958 RepID=UPI00257C0F7A|nr:BrnA antitoxin family protein [Candidatus Cyanaurora vandensis]